VSIWERHGHRAIIWYVKTSDFIRELRALPKVHVSRGVDLYLHRIYKIHKLNH